MNLPGIRIRVALILAGLTLAVPVSLIAQLPSGYGRRSGAGYQDSVNGTAELIRQLKEVGILVQTRSFVSPRIERFQTVIWIPDSFAPPGPRVEKRLEQWLLARPNRLLIYVGRDYDGALDYWREQQSQAGSQTTGNDGRPLSEIAQRQFARSHAQHLKRRYRQDWQGSSWYEAEESAPGPIDQLSGDLVDEPHSEWPAFEWGAIRLKPTQPAVGRKNRVLLLANDQPFVFEQEFSNNSRVVVVNNGSAVLNYPLVKDHATSPLVDLISNRQVSREVLILESGELGLPIVNSDSPPTMWSWIQQKPLAFIVPHALALGIIACFTFFPIFGRPRRGIPRQATRFRRHIQAIGTLLMKSNDTGSARQAIERYRTQIKRDGP